MTKNNDLSKAHIVLVDSDARVAGVMKQALRGMGFESVSIAENALDVMDLVEQEGIDLLITEWDAGNITGTQLAKLLRDPDYNPNVMMPIMMSTARAEVTDVKNARDSGFSEFIVKPFTSQSLFARLKRSIDNPPDFVISTTFTGPDRRRRGAPPPGKRDLRVQEPLKIPELKKNLVGERPVLVANDKLLRKKTNLVQPLDEIITVELLEVSQNAINSFHRDATSWIGGDIIGLEEAVAALRVQPQAKTMVEELLLSIKSRAGLFGYDNAAKIAFDLYLFMRHGFDPQNEVTINLAERYVDVMKVLLSPSQEASNPMMQQKLMSELERMTLRVRQQQW